MIIYFDFKGEDLSQANLSNTYLDNFSFINNKEGYCIDLTGEVDFSFSKKEISGRFKGDFDLIISEETNLSKEDIINKIMNMDKSSFEFNIFEEEIKYDSLDVCIQINDNCLEIRGLKNNGK